MRWMFTVGAAALALVLSQPSAAQIAGEPTTPATPPASASEPDFELGEGVLLTVNDQLITSYDLRQRMLLLIFESQLQPTEESLPAIQQEALRRLIDQRLQAAELARYEVEIPDSLVYEEIAAIAQQMGVGADAMLAAMEDFGIRRDTYVQQLRVMIGWRMLVAGRYRDRARVSSDQIDAVLARIAENATKPQWLVGEIYIDAATVGGQQTALNGANQLVQQILAGGPGVFQAVARQFSSAPSASSGGDGGWVVSGEPPAGVEAVLQQMDPGQLSRPIPVDGGVYIILLRDERSGAVTTLAHLRQAAIRLDPTATEAEVAQAVATLGALRDGLTCDNIVQRANATPGVVGADLGEANIADLAEQFQPIARTGEIGGVSQPIRTPLGLHLVAVCGRRSASDDIPSREQVEAELVNQQLSMLARRWIRDLRNAATIEQRDA